MLDVVKKHNKKVLIAIDELANNPFTRSFFHDFQTLLRGNHPIYCVATGLYENVCSLENSKTLTFLYRLPKIFLLSLNKSDIEDRYFLLFKNKEDSIKLALLTKGYAFAFQVAGFLYQKYKSYEKIINEFDIYLKLYVYDKIWEKLPEGERKVLLCFDNEVENTKDLLSKTGYPNKQFSVYRDRLIKRGVVISTSFGQLTLSLPRFLNFLNNAETY